MAVVNSKPCDNCFLTLEFSIISLVLIPINKWVLLKESIGMWLRLALLFSPMPLFQKKYWPEAFNTAVYLINRLPSLVLLGKTPFKCLFAKVPNYTFLPIFGLAYWPNL